jgi:hypothetical protein
MGQKRLKPLMFHETARKKGVFVVMCGHLWSSVVVFRPERVGPFGVIPASFDLCASWFETGKRPPHHEAIGGLILRRSRCDRLEGEAALKGTEPTRRANRPEFPKF